ncbi:phage tail tip lysozyme [Carnobacterium divergens]|nr:phage tail tip lysozyme [Carnobacterium divergens]MDO0875235.1 phage tail tip lysozyme [Carnobacterium divergens]
MTMVNFTSTQLETAKIVWNTLKLFNYSDISAAGVIGNLYAESALNPHVNEHGGGGGYGLGQWTPKSNVYSQARVCGISNSEAETAQGQATIIAQGDKTGQWSNYGNTAYHPTVQRNQTLSEFKQSSSLTAAAADFCAHWERPDVALAHMEIRIDAANSIYELLKGQTGTNTDKKGEIEMQLTYRVNNNEPTFYFDGIAVKQLAHGDELEILRRIYKANNDKDMPHMEFSSSAPYYERLLNVANREYKK